jgi:hypothetical protein
MSFRRSQRALAQNISKYYALQFCLGMHFFSAVLVPFYTDWGHISFADIMLLQSLFVFFSFALELPPAADARKKTSQTRSPGLGWRRFFCLPFIRLSPRRVLCLTS